MTWIDCNQGPGKNISLVEGNQGLAMVNGIRKVGLTTILSLVLATCASAQMRGGFGGRGAGGLAHTSPGSSRGFPAAPRPILGTPPGVFRPAFTHPLAGTPLNPNFAPIRGVPGGRPLVGTPLTPNFAPIWRVPGGRPLAGTPLSPNFAPIGGRPRHGLHPFENQFGRGRGLFPYYSIFFDTLPLDYDAYYGDQYPYGYDNQYPPESSAVPDYYTQQPQFMIPQPGTVPPAESAPSAPAATPVPPPELGQLILVRRDGKVLLAVAFTVRNGELTYVTTEGTRRTFPLSELDKEATRQMNDANGTSVSLPD